MHLQENVIQYLSVAENNKSLSLFIINILCHHTAISLVKTHVWGHLLSNVMFKLRCSRCLTGYIGRSLFCQCQSWNKWQLQVQQLLVNYAIKPNYQTSCSWVPPSHSDRGLVVHVVWQSWSSIKAHSRSWSFFSIIGAACITNLAHAFIVSKILS